MRSYLRVAARLMALNYLHLGRGGGTRVLGGGS
jgi:hypothetical protein